VAKTVITTLDSETSSRKVGSSRNCLMLRELAIASNRGFSRSQAAHVSKCLGCKNAYSSYLALKRNEARMQLNLPAWEDLK
jgi:hypothetical protein